MRSLFSSLQFRLVAGFAVILSAALLSVSWYVSAESGRQADHSASLRSEVQAERVRAALVEHFADRKGWEGAQPAVERLGRLLGARIVVRDGGGRIVADSHRRLGPPRFEHGIRDAPLLAGDGSNVGSIDFVSARDLLEGQRLEPLDSDLASRVSEALLWAGLAAGGAGIVAVGLIARRALSPVRALSTAAERLGQGDLAQRVDPSTEDEVGRLGHAFNRMAADLEQAERQRRGLMADVAHELRTPLSNIRGYVEAMRDGVAERDDDTLDIVQQQIAHLTRLVEDLRLLALAEAGELALHPQPERMDDLLRSVADAFGPRAAEKGVAIRREPAADLPLVSMDRGRVEQVLHNLVENAVTHTPEGGTVTLSAAVGDTGFVRVSVSDTGPGMEREALDAVFERFYRLDPSRARATGGAGLGLTIAKQLIEAQDGRIWAESEPGQGSTFIFELPLGGATA